MYNFLEKAKQEEQQAIMLQLARVFENHGIPDNLAKLYDLILHLAENPRKDSLGKVLKTLRPLLSSETPLLEDLVLAIFAGTPLSSPLKKSVFSLPQPDSVADLFTVTREETLKEYPSLSNRSPFYYMKTPLFTWNGLVSRRPGTLLFGSFYPYDPKASGYNSSGLLFQEKNGIDWSVGPTPTIGDQLAPETRALLRALKKRRSTLFPYDKWIYINLQNTQSASEKRRSRALLEASKKNPDQFRLASISVDAPFYKGNMKAGPTELKEHLYEAIFQPSHRSWYAFSLLHEEREAWAKIVETVLDQAYELGPSPIVFHELVVLGLIRAWQSFHTKENTGRVLSTTACKECIDRGGSVNSAFLWALQSSAQEVMAVLWGRPLLSRYRLIMPSRTRGFEALVETFTPDMVKDFLSSIWMAAKN